MEGGEGGSRWGEGRRDECGTWIVDTNFGAPTDAASSSWRIMDPLRQARAQESSKKVFTK